ncbi:MAG: leucine-rich repeat domain-containing protein [Acutalibacteraceae bacterium]
MKKTMFKKMLILCLVLTMALSAFSVNASAADTDDDFRLLCEYFDDGFCNVIGYEGSLPQDLVIPNQVDGYTVYSINDGVFADCDTLRSVEGGNLACIGQGAFAECDNLESVVLNGTYDIFDVFCVECYAFQNCKKLKTFSTTNGSSWYAAIYEGAFMGCSALETITMYATFVGENAFLGCASLKTVHFLGYKPDYYYDSYGEMVSDNGNVSFFRADWIWDNYPAEEVERSYFTVNYQPDKEYTYTMHTPIEAGQRVIYRDAYFNDYDVSVWVDMENQAPGTMIMHPSASWYNYVGGTTAVVLVVVDEEGKVLREEYVTVHIKLSAKQISDKFFERMINADSFLEYFRAAIEGLYQLLKYTLNTLL